VNVAVVVCFGFAQRVRGSLHRHCRPTGDETRFNGRARLQPCRRVFKHTRLLTAEVRLQFRGPFLEMFFDSASLTIVILRACDFFDLFVFSAYPTSCISSPRQIRHPERSASQIYPKQRALWRGVEEPVPNVAEGTPAMFVGRCSWELSGRKLHRKIRKSQTLYIQTDEVITIPLRTYKRCGW
jgi:hypothetical protein